MALKLSSTPHSHEKETTTTQATWPDLFAAIVRQETLHSGRLSKARFTGYNFVARDMLLTSLGLKLIHVNQTYSDCCVQHKKCCGLFET